MASSDLARELATVRAQQKQVRQRRRLNTMSALRVPMVAGLRVVQGTNGGATAQSDGTTIFADGRLSNQVMAHEAAHVLDSQVMTDADRRRFSMILGQPNGKWENVETLPNGQRQAAHNSVEEKFADMVSMIATRNFPQPGRGGGYPYLENPPSQREILRFGRALERLGKRYNLARYQRPA